MFALTVDQQSSRAGHDGVPAVLDLLNGLDITPIRAFERTAGDEIQGLGGSGDDVVRWLDLLVDREVDESTPRWWIGIGIGAVSLRDSVRASNGPALVNARDAVERAKREPTGLALSVGATETHDGFDAETALQWLVAVRRDRSAAGREAVEAMGRHDSQAAAAAELDISAQAMSQRLRSAKWHEETRVRALAVRLLDRADQMTGERS